MSRRLVRREGGGWSRYAQPLANMAAAAAGNYARQAFNNAVRGSRGSSRGGDGGNSTAVTGQTDHKLRFKLKKKGKKGMRRAMRAKKFRSKVLSVLQKDQNPQWIRLKSFAAVTGAANNQTVTWLGGLHTFSASQGTGSGDIAAIYEMMSPVVWQQLLGGTNQAIQQKDNSKFTVKSAHMELDISNRGTEAMVLDVYELVARKDPNFTSLQNMLTVPNEYWQGAGGTSVQQPNTMGVSPYQMDDITTNFKILGKTTYQIAAGGAVSLAMSVKGRRTYMGSDLVGTVDQPCKRGCTKLYLGIARGVPSALGNTGPHSFSYENRRQYNVALATNLYPDTATSTNVSG